MILGSRFASLRFLIGLGAFLLFFFLGSHQVFAEQKALDSDGDHLNDAQEAITKTDPLKSDTDGDGYTDGMEIAHDYDPLDPQPLKGKKSIRVHLKSQTLEYLIGKTVINKFRISSGKPSLPTPTGTFNIINKEPRAWSKLAKLWMPYWMGFKGGKFGIHELPEWPNGFKEGANHLGKPVSHGCIRLGVGDAKKLYSWATIGTPLTITQ